MYYKLHCVLNQSIIYMPCQFLTCYSTALLAHSKRVMTSPFHILHLTVYLHACMPFLSIFELCRNIWIMHICWFSLLPLWRTYVGLRIYFSTSAWKEFIEEGKNLGFLMSPWFLLILFLFIWDSLFKDFEKIFGFGKLD